MGKRAAGINIPVFSLRSKKGLGTGEFLDLIPFIDWAKKAGLTYIQLLPINDTSIGETEEDAHPYSILSVFALHPLYINIHALAPEFDGEIRPIAQELNKPHLDYAKTYWSKMELLRMIFLIRGEKDLSTKAFEQFFKKNEDHLKAYAAFSLLKELHKTGDFRKWGKFAKYSELLVNEVCEKNDVEFFYFVQFHLDKQLKEVVSHAKKQEITLKGDLSMGVHPNSVEAWRFYEYFRWDQSMGAPPDFYNSLGQNWGFPSYNWDEIKQESFFWFKSRLKWMEQYFGAVRLDHVLGYFRLWEVPIDQVRGLMGSFFPATGYSKEELASLGLFPPFSPKLPKGYETQRKIEKKVKNLKEREKLYAQVENCLFFEREGNYHPRIDIKHTEAFQALDLNMQKAVFELFEEYYLRRQEPLWYEKGREKLTYMQKHTSMLICAEDIGVIPDCASKVLKELGILNLHLQRMPKRFDLLYENPEDFPASSVCTPSNHDTATLREWWEEDEEKTALYYHRVLKHEGTPPKKLTEKLAQEIIQAHLHSKSRIAIFLLQDLLAMSDSLRFPNPKEIRINDPADPLNKWNWRCHIYVEELLLASSFTKQIHDMVRGAKR